MNRVDKFAVQRDIKYNSYRYCCAVGSYHITSFSIHKTLICALCIWFFPLKLPHSRDICPFVIYPGFLMRFMPTNQPTIVEFHKTSVIFSCLLKLVMINWKLIMFRWKGWWSLFQVKTNFHQLSSLKTLQIAPKTQMITKGADCNDSNLNNHRSEWNIIRTVNSKTRQYFIESHENSSRFNDWWCNCRISSITWNYHFQ